MLLLSDAILCSIALAVLGGIFFLILSTRLRQFAERHARLDAAVRDLERLEDRMEERFRGRIDGELKPIREELTALGERLTAVSSGLDPEALRTRLDDLQEALSELASRPRGELEGDSSSVSVLEGIDRLREQVAELGQAHVELRANLARVSEGVSETVATAMGEAMETQANRGRMPGQGGGVVEIVTSHLRAEGYGRIAILGGDVAREPNGTVQVVVEAVRDDVTYKGGVVVVDGKVTEQSLRPSYSMFP